MFWNTENIAKASETMQHMLDQCDNDAIVQGAALKNLNFFWTYIAFPNSLDYIMAKMIKLLYLSIFLLLECSGDI